MEFRNVDTFHLSKCFFFFFRLIKYISLITPKIFQPTEYVVSEIPQQPNRKDYQFTMPPAKIFNPKQIWGISKCQKENWLRYLGMYKEDPKYPFMKARKVVSLIN